MAGSVTVAESRYLSVGANRYAAAADWGDDGLVAFGADTNVGLWNPSNAKGITKLLRGHKAHVRAVKFLPRFSGEASTYLVTGGDDHCLKVWKLNVEDGSSSLLLELENEHTKPINCIAALSTPVGGKKVFVSGAADATVLVWAFDPETNTLTRPQTIKTTRGYLPLAVALSPLDNDGGLILAIAGTSNAVQIFTTGISDRNSTDVLNFSLQATLAGHENWIRSLDFIHESSDSGSDLLLASASQDKYIRLWRVHQGTALSALNAGGAVGLGMSSKLTDALTPGNKIHKIKAADKNYCVMFEALLLGHEDWIYTARWNRTASNKLRLLSASADNSLSVWEADPESGIWITVARLGEISREKGATTATGSIGGFWTGLWSPSGTTVVTLGRTGSWRRWDYDSEYDVWKQGLAVSGHTRAVTGIAWSRDGSYLLSTSSDQTTRLHAEWTTGDGRGTWHEMSRPQIHGYDLNCIDSLGNSSFVSGADEKLMRVFTEPKAVAKMLRRLTGRSAATAGGSDNFKFDARVPDAANMPVLGLSNKAVDVVDDTNADDADVDTDTDRQLTPPQAVDGSVDPASMVRKSALEIDHPPLEENLSRHTLWPEVEKLYGHGYEISCLAVSHDGRLIASACKASSINHAVIRLFETERWTEIKPPLAAHSLTATRLRFSPAPAADRFLLSVGRDRQWAVFERQGDDDGSSSQAEYKLLQSNPKGHSRMILDAAWARPVLRSAEDGGDVFMFATAGRDKQIKLWKKTEGGKGFELAQTIAQEEHPVTALDFMYGSKGQFILAAGTEAGNILVASFQLQEKEGDDAGGVVVTAPTITRVSRDLELPKAVMQLAWRPSRQKEDKEAHQKDGNGNAADRHELAVAGEDGSLRIYSIRGDMD
ncbi:Elongator complex protein 2 [Diplogelasinospora grovesii]|uniref:Elongator complex protein 2 n=1 Tax=Diplogelasinospora grovesii TaxID=303347 RepID=A0AAN6NI72_9PEZI|nr:Elongator complex protein 2 [Diplogelasinospora grovesii]